MPNGHDLVPPPSSLGAALIGEAREAGLLDDKTGHARFHAPRALIEAAKRETGPRPATEPGLAALTLLTRPDPVTAAMKRTRDALGPSHTLEH